MQLGNLTKYIVKHLVADPDTVSVKEFEGVDDSILIEVLVLEKDIGKIIGKDGRMINNIKTIVQASSSLYDNKLVKINVESY